MANEAAGLDIMIAEHLIGERQAAHLLRAIASHYVGNKCDFVYYMGNAKYRINLFLKVKHTERIKSTKFKLNAFSEKLYTFDKVLRYHEMQKCLPIYPFYEFLSFMENVWK